MKILVVGNGAREHTLVWKLAQSPKVKALFVAPGNVGTATLARNLSIAPTNIEALAKAAQENKIELVVVGPEAPLADGIVDHFQILGIPIFGPTKAAARIESSKVFARELMEKYKIPCPTGVIFSSYTAARQLLKQSILPIVIKADGLAAGKGVTVAKTRKAALEALRKTMKDRVFGSAGSRVIIDEYVSGREASLIVFTDGWIVVPMVPACDYKPIFDGNKGPNTGGMGGYSPPEFLNKAWIEEVTETILEPAVQAMRVEGRHYKGVLYTGLVITPDEEAKVFEFNARFGDPENQVTMPRLKKPDLVEIMMAVVEERLDLIEPEIEWSDEACVGVVMASGGYPGDYKKGFPITGLDQLDKDILVFHAGTKRVDGQVVTDGGRVLTVVATGKTIAEARGKVYDNIPRIHFDGCYYRKDIALPKEY